jgi:hypothetical protein
LDFAKWSPCLAHLREFGHVEASALDKTLNNDFRRVQEMCALFYTHRLSHLLLTGRGSSDPSSSSDDSEDDAEQKQIAERRKERRAARRRRFNFSALPDKVVFKINAFLDVDSATALFRAITSGLDKSTDESRVNRWSGGSHDSKSTVDGSETMHWSLGSATAASPAAHGAILASSHHNVVDGANLRWSTGNIGELGKKLA